MASVLWVFYASKVPEFFDTVLMCLKQNFRQITFLHVSHLDTAVADCVATLV
jgi:elongation of very long chain fatty acids protein 4